MMHARRLARVGAGAALLLTAAACRDAGITSSAERIDAASVPSLSKSGSNSGRRTGYQKDTVVTVIRTDPTKRVTYGIGRDHRLTFSAYSICDPATSTYGPTEWDQPCQALTESIQIVAKSWYEKGRPHVQFSPALRFVPGTLVVLSLRDEEAAQDPDAVIYYCDALGVCFDDALLDPTLRTYRDPKSGYLSRRIKHFSGYNVPARLVDEDEELADDAI